MFKEINFIDDPNILNELTTFPNQGLIWEIVETRKTGKIFQISDNLVMLVENGDIPFVFISGNLHENLIDNIISYLRKANWPRIFCKEKYHGLFLKRKFEYNLRVELQFKNFACSISQNDYTKVIPIDSLELLRKCVDCNPIAKLYISEADILENTIGYGLFNENTILSAAFATIHRGYAEISIATHPNYYSKGYATNVAIALIKKCLEKQLIPIWSNNIDNKASFNTALKLGFEPVKYYVQLVPNFGNILKRN